MQNLSDVKRHWIKQTLNSLSKNSIETFGCCNDVQMLQDDRCFFVLIWYRNRKQLRKSWKALQMIKSCWKWSKNICDLRECLFVMILKPMPKFLLKLGVMRLKALIMLDVSDSAKDQNTKILITSAIMWMVKNIVRFWRPVIEINQKDDCFEPTLALQWNYWKQTDATKPDDMSLTKKR